MTDSHTPRPGPWDSKPETTAPAREAAVADRVGILHEGQLVAIGAPVDLVANLPARAPTLDDVFTHHTGSGLSS